MHRDVALRNVFLKTTTTIKLGDFGLSRKLVEGTLSYVPSTVTEVCAFTGLAIKVINVALNIGSSQICGIGIVTIFNLYDRIGIVDIRRCIVGNVHICTIATI